MTVYASINGKTVTKARLVVGSRGPWFLDAELDSSADNVTGRVTVKIDDVTLIGTVSPSESGVFGQSRSVRIVAGAGAWSKLLGARPYHNDAGVKASNVAQDAARDAGETMGLFKPQRDRVGVDYVREAGLASRVLEDVIGSAQWWVDFAGVTQVGARPSAVVAAKDYEITGYDPRSKLLKLHAAHFSVINVGSILSKDIDSPQVVREFEAILDGEDLTILAWCGPSSENRLTSIFQKLVERAVGDKLFGPYRYRVIRMSAERVELQAVNKAAGLPDIEPISMWPGVAGSHAELAPGAEVMVQFEEGDRTKPFISAFVGKGGPGFVPQSLKLCDSEQRAARQGDLVQSGGPGTIVILTPVTGVGAPPNNAVVAGVPHLISFSSDPLAVGPLAAPLYGAISTGSPKVNA